MPIDIWKSIKNEVNLLSNFKYKPVLSGFFQKYKNENAESYDFVMRNETFNVNNTVFYSEKNLNP